MAVANIVVLNFKYWCNDQGEMLLQRAATTHEGVRVQQIAIPFILHASVWMCYCIIAMSKPNAGKMEWNASLSPTLVFVLTIHRSLTDLYGWLLSPSLASSLDETSLTAVTTNDSCTQNRSTPFTMYGDLLDATLVADVMSIVRLYRFIVTYRQGRRDTDVCRLHMPLMR
jgi:hypothetical protein